MNATLAALRTAIKGCSRFYIHAHRDPLAPSYSDAAVFVLSCVRDVKVKGQTRRAEVISKIEVRGRIGHGHTSRVVEHVGTYGKFPKCPDAYRTERGFWSLWNVDVFRSAVLSLPGKCEPFFCVSLDGLTTEGHMRVGFHGDALYLEGRTQDRGAVRTFLLDTNTGAHNTARFGSPTHENDQGSFEAWEKCRLGEGEAR